MDSFAYLLFIEGRFKIISTLLRGTLYTLMSDVDKAIADYNIVIESGESPENNPVCIIDVLIYMDV